MKSATSIITILLLCAACIGLGGYYFLRAKPCHIGLSELTAERQVMPTSISGELTVCELITVTNISHRSVWTNAPIHPTMWPYSSLPNKEVNLDGSEHTVYELKPGQELYFPSNATNGKDVTFIYSYDQTDAKGDVETVIGETELTF